MKFEKHLQKVDREAEKLCSVSDALWDNPETALGEYAAEELITGVLESYGFTVTRGVAGIPTAFTASYGSGSPHLGVLAEYDGLPSMSQEAGIAERKPIPGKDTNHGCGHNLFAGGSIGAVLAVMFTWSQTIVHLPLLSILLMSFGFMGLTMLAAFAKKY